MRRYAWFAVLAASVALAGCEPDFDATAFRCDTDRGGDRGCPDRQTCVAGRCRRGDVPASTIGCMGTTCTTPDQQCCIDGTNPPRCIAAGEVCPGVSALCDGRADCADDDYCCGTPTTACAERCLEKETSCISATDCPAAEPHCCDDAETPWGRCAKDPC